MWQYIPTEELYHHGILGQKWGVRRYQNPDGTLTKAGKKRLAKDEYEISKIEAERKYSKKVKNTDTRRINAEKIRDVELARAKAEYRKKMDSIKAEYSKRGSDNGFDEFKVKKSNAVKEYTSALLAGTASFTIGKLLSKAASKMSSEDTKATKSSSKKEDAKNEKTTKTEKTGGTKETFDWDEIFTPAKDSGESFTKKHMNDIYSDDWTDVSDRQTRSYNSSGYIGSYISGYSSASINRLSSGSTPQIESHISGYLSSPITSLVPYR